MSGLQNAPTDTYLVCAYAVYAGAYVCMHGIQVSVCAHMHVCVYIFGREHVSEMN